MEISAGMVKELRECTGAGMMDCKQALAEAEGDMGKAVDILRTKGLADLAKKAGRATNEGIIGSYVAEDGLVGALVEVNCETDFVARNADFQAFVTAVAKQVAVAAPDDVATLMTQNVVDDESLPFEQYFGERVARIGENIVISRFTRFETEPGAGKVAAYVHGVGNIGVLVQIAADTPEAAASDALPGFAKDVAMQIAAAAPLAVTRDEVPADVVSHEAEIYKAQAAASGKPEHIQEKIAQGRLEKYFKEVALVEQPFVKDADISVAQLADRVSKEAGGTVSVTRFARFVLGESVAETAESE